MRSIMRLPFRPNGRLRRGTGRECAAAILVLLLSCAVLVTASASASNPERSSTSWGDSFSSIRGIKTLDGTKVSGGKVELEEGQAADLGEAVPGEYAVYAVLATALGANHENIYCGTGEKGHLVEYDPAEQYQEAYQGPTHFGVSNSRGQAVTAPVQSEVRALTTDGTLVYGGTYPDGHLFVFDPSHPERKCVDRGACPGTSGAVLALACDGSTVFAATSAGDVFSYSGGDSGTFTDLGQPEGGTSVNTIATLGGSVYAGLSNGKIYRYSAGVFTELCRVASPIDSLAVAGTAIYLGTGTSGDVNGRLYSYDTSSPGAPADLGAPTGHPEALLSLASSGSDIYAGSQGGHLFLFDGTWKDLGVPANSGGKPINALSVAGGVIYGGTGTSDAASTGRLFRRCEVEEYYAASDNTAISGINFQAKRIYFSTAGGKLYADIGGTEKCREMASFGAPISSLSGNSGWLYAGLSTGHLCVFDGDDAIEIAALDQDPPATLTKILYSGLKVYMGFSNGKLYQAAISPLNPKGPATTTLIDTLPAGVNDLTWVSQQGDAGALYIACENGHMYRYRRGDAAATDLGVPAGETALRALSVFDGLVYAGYASGKLYSFDPATPGYTPRGDCGSPVTAMAAGSQGVACGTRAGTQFFLDVSGDSGLHMAPDAPGSSGVTALARVNGSIIGGTSVDGADGGKLYSIDDAFLGDRGQVVEKQISVFCMEYDGARHSIYGGTYRNAHFLIIDTVTGSVIDRGRPINGEREIEDILVTSEGKVYGATYGGTNDIYNADGGHLFAYDPDTGSFTDKGRPPDPQHNWWVSALIDGGGGVIYGTTANTVYDNDGTHSQGIMFSYSGSEGFADLGVPIGNEGTRCLCKNGGLIFGATWDYRDSMTSHVYAYDTARRAFTTLGDTPAPTGEAAYQKFDTSMLVSGGSVYCGQHNGNLFSFSSSAADPAAYLESLELLGKPVAGTTAVPTLAGGPDGTIMCGTENNSSTPPGGHVASYDPALGEFRDISSFALPHVKVVSLARDESGSGSLYGATGVTIDAAGHATEGSKLFKIDAYRSGAQYGATSVNIDPRVVELGACPVAQEGVGAISAAPAGKKQLYAGTSNAASGPDALVFEYDSLTGFVTGRRWTVGSGQKRVLALCEGPDGKIYGGTGAADSDTGPDAVLFRFDPGNAGPSAVEDLDVNIPAGTKGIFAVTAGANGKIYFGAGDLKSGGGWVKGALYEYDPVAGTTVKKGETGGSGRLAVLAAASDGKIYGGSAPSPGQSSTAQFMKFDPASDSSPPAFSSIIGSGNAGVDAMAVMPAEQGGALYCSTGPSGALYRATDPSSMSLTQVANWPYTGEPALSLTAAGGKVYGCAGSRGKLFAYDPSQPEGSRFSDIGELSYGNAGVAAATTDNFDKPCFGTTGDAKLVRFDPSMKFGWKTASYDSTIPAGTSASVSVLDEAGTVLATVDHPAGTDISGLPMQRLCLKAVLQTTDPALTPSIQDWGVTWDLLPNLDRVDSERAAGAYRTEPVTIWGSNLGTVPGSVTIGGKDVTIAPGSWHDNHVDVTVPADASSGDVRVTVNSKVVETSFTLLELPHIASVICPRSAGAYRGESVTIQGSNFGTVPGIVTIGEDEATVAPGNWHNDQIDAVVPQAAKTGAVKVTVNDKSDDSTFDLLDTPQIDGVSPSSAHRQDYVDITGTSFMDNRSSQDGVTFRGVACTEYSLWSDRKITARVPAGATTGDLRVTVNGHTSGAFHFVVNPGTGPSVSITAPSRGATVSGKVTVDATVRRSGGSEPVELWVDGARVGIDGSAPYALTWDSEGASDGAHAIVVKAKDEFGQSGSDAITLYTNHSVPAASDHWYFAEGCTDYGFETWLLIQNPDDKPTVARIDFMGEDGTVTHAKCDLPANSRASINAADYFPHANVSMEVSSDSRVVCERSMYWANRIEGHDSIGATSLAKTWYFAEGCTGYGFETFVLLGNPGDAPVTATLRYMYPKGGGAAKTHVVPAHSRLTVDASADVGAKEFSVRVDSGVPGLVAERSMYHGGRRCGTDTIGAREPSNTWFLSEGCTDYGFETWLLIQRPEPGDARVRVQFRLGSGETINRSYTVKGESRYTVDVADEVGKADVSTQVTSDKPVICERSMYWNERTAGHCSIGSPGPGTTWYMAEGCTDYGFETWLLLDNPGAEKTTATVTFMKEDGTTVPVSVDLKPHSRTSIDASRYVPATSFSTKVNALTPVMCERAMYWNNRSGGTESIGAR